MHMQIQMKNCTSSGGSRKRTLMPTSENRGNTICIKKHFQGQIVAKLVVEGVLKEQGPTVRKKKSCGRPRETEDCCAL
jgi:hypothetical protein